VIVALRLDNRQGSGCRSNVIHEHSPLTPTWTNYGERSPGPSPSPAGPGCSPQVSPPIPRLESPLSAPRRGSPHVTIRRSTRTTSRGNTNAGSTSLIAVIMQRGSYETAHRLPSVRTRFWSQTPPHPHLQRLSRLLLAFLQERLQQAYRAGRGR
jgi:hypothetical protein